MSTKDNNATIAPDSQTGQAQSQVSEEDQAPFYTDDDLFPSDADLMRGAIDFDRDETFRRMIRAGNFSEKDFDLFDAFYNESPASKIQGLTVPTLLGDQSLFGAFAEIVKCTQAFGTHPRYPLDDTGIANLFANAFKYKLRYVPERKQWYQYADGKWGPGDAEAMECCKALTQELKQYASNDEFYSKNAIPSRTVL